MWVNWEGGVRPPQCSREKDKNQYKKNKKEKKGVSSRAGKKGAPIAAREGKLSVHRGRKGEPSRKTRPVSVAGEEGRPASPCLLKGQKEGGSGPPTLGGESTLGGGGESFTRSGKERVNRRSSAGRKRVRKWRICPRTH